MAFEETKKSPFERLIEKQPAGVGRLLDFAFRGAPTIDEAEGMIATMHDKMTVDQRSNFLPFLVGYLHAIAVQGKGKATMTRLLDGTIAEAMKEYLGLGGESNEIHKP